MRALATKHPNIRSDDVRWFSLFLFWWLQAGVSLWRTQVTQQSTIAVRGSGAPASVLNKLMRCVWLWTLSTTDGMPSIQTTNMSRILFSRTYRIFPLMSANANGVGKTSVIFTSIEHWPFVSDFSFIYPTLQSKANMAKVTGILGWFGLSQFFGQKKYVWHCNRQCTWLVSKTLRTLESSQEQRNGTLSFSFTVGSWHIRFYQRESQSNVSPGTHES